MPKLIDLTGKRFGRLTVLKRATDKQYKRPHWLCQCDCGNQKIIHGDSLRGGLTQSCGCLQKERTSQATIKDLTGQQFGKLTVLCRDQSIVGKGTHAKWICQCQCGNIISVNQQSLTNKGQISCGCSKSIGEYNIANILTANNIIFVKEYKFDDLKHNSYLRYDFAVFSADGHLQRLIEFDGTQHNDTSNHWYTEDGVKRDKLKNEYAMKNNIPLVRIPYSKRDSLTIEDLLGELYLYKGE